jgi:hypothetical protein
MQRDAARGAEDRQIADSALVLDRPPGADLCATYPAIGDTLRPLDSGIFRRSVCQRGGPRTDPAGVRRTLREVAVGRCDRSACEIDAAECRRHEALGAAVAYEGRVWTTLRDPAGIAYCITRRDPDTGTL